MYTMSNPQTVFSFIMYLDLPPVKLHPCLINQVSFEISWHNHFLAFLSFLELLTVVSCIVFCFILMFKKILFKDSKDRLLLSKTNKLFHTTLIGA